MSCEAAAGVAAEGRAGEEDEGAAVPWRLAGDAALISPPVNCAEKSLRAIPPRADAGDASASSRTAASSLSSSARLARDRRLDALSGVRSVVGGGSSRSRGGVFGTVAPTRVAVARELASIIAR